MTLTKVTYSMINTAPINVIDYGAVGDGTTDDLAAIQAAYTATPTGGTLLFPVKSTGITAYLISGTWTISKQINVVFQSAIGGSYPGAYILKKSTLNGTAISIYGSNANGTRISGGGVYGDVGNGGNGIDILANDVVLDNVYAHECGQDGIRIGSATESINCNSYLLINPYCNGNDRHGIYVSDSFGPSINANAGTIVAPRCVGNTDDGIQIEVANATTIISPLVELNGGAGIRAGFNCSGLTIVGGDVAEGNVGGDIVRDAGCYNVQIFGSNYVNPTNNDLYIDMTTKHINSGTGSTGIGFGVASSTEGNANILKAGIAFQRADTNGRGTLWFCVDGANDTQDFILSDAKLGITYDSKIQALAPIYPANTDNTSQSASAIFAGTGAPSNAQGNNGDFYLRSDGGAGTSIYQKRTGSWIGIV